MRERLREARTQMAESKVLFEVAANKLLELLDEFEVRVETGELTPKPAVEPPSRLLPAKEYPLAIERDQLGFKWERYDHPEAFGVQLNMEGRLFRAMRVGPGGAGFVENSPDGLGTLLAYQGEGSLAYRDAIGRSEEPITSFWHFLDEFYEQERKAPQ